jgi:hypothetical protein
MMIFHGLIKLVWESRYHSLLIFIYETFEIKNRETKEMTNRRIMLKHHTKNSRNLLLIHYLLSQM